MVCAASCVWVAHLALRVTRTWPAAADRTRILRSPTTCSGSGPLGGGGGPSSSESPFLWNAAPFTLAFALAGERAVVLLPLPLSEAESCRATGFVVSGGTADFGPVGERDR
jgi:hypothetical protein